MGEVYLGIDETLRRKVALKAIRPEYRLDSAAKKRFLREARTLSQLDHPNICRVFDYLETEDRDWLVLELIEGVTLSETIGRNRTHAERLRIAEQIAAVLVATHAAGLVHRDLKPGNVMLTHAGEVKVLDFGLSAVAGRPVPMSEEELSEALNTPEMRTAALEETQFGPSSPMPLDGSVFHSEAGAVKGTVGYMSPEQARGEIATAASDMYSFGLVLQELFTGQRPYEPGEYGELLDRARRGESRDSTGVPAPIGALIKRLKSVAPSQRPTAVDAIEQLQWIAAAPARRRRNLIAAALVVAAIGGAIKYTVDLSRERNAAIAARDEAQRRRGQAEGLIGFMVGDLRERLAAVGSLEILDNVGKKALDYFASVPSNELTDEELHRRSEALHQLGQVMQARANLPGALQAYEESLTQAEEVARRQPDNADFQLGLGTSHFYVGDLKMRAGDLTQALAHFEAYKNIADKLAEKDPANRQYRLEQSYGHSNVAAIYSRQGRLAEARDHLLTVSTIQSQLAKEQPNDKSIQTSQSNNFNRLAIVQDSLGELQAAADNFGRELEMYHALLKSDDKDTRIRRRLLVGYIFRGTVFRALGRQDEATSDLSAALAEAAALHKLDATNATWSRDLASATFWLARLDLDGGDTAHARARLLAEREIVTALFDKNPSRASERRDVASNAIAMAETYRRDRNLQAARREIDRAIEMLAPLLAKNGNDPDVTRDMALAENERGQIAAPAGDRKTAQEAWTHTVALLEKRAADSRDRTILDPWVRALMLLGRMDDARQGLERLNAIGYRDRGFIAFRNNLDATLTQH